MFGLFAANLHSELSGSVYSLAYTSRTAARQRHLPWKYCASSLLCLNVHVSGATKCHMLLLFYLCFHFTGMCVAMCLF